MLCGPRNLLLLRPSVSLQRRSGPVRCAFRAPAGGRDPEEPDGEDQQEGPRQAVLSTRPRPGVHKPALS